MSVAFSSVRSLFAGDPDIKTEADLASRFEDFKKALDGAPNTGNGTAELVPAEGGNVLRKADNPVDQLNRLLDQQAVEKALGGDALNSLRQSLANAGGDITKDINLTSPVATGLVQFDLEAPAKYLVPIETPLRNKLPRKKGMGTSRRYKRITGFSNAQTGTGLPTLHPGITDTTQNNFNAGAANPEWFIRGPKISYTGDDHQVAYIQFGLSDQVTWSAQWAGQGFQDIRQLSQSSVLYSSMLAEERMTVYGRGASGNGFSGALATLTGLTGTAGTGGQLAAGNYQVFVAPTSGFGTGIAQSVTVNAVAADGSIAVYWNPVPGAVGYQVYVTQAGATGAANAHYVGTVGSNGSATTPAITITLAPTAGATAPTADTSAQANGYDGIIPIVLGADSGYRANINAPFSTGNPGTEFQDAFDAMYATNLADPDEVLFNGSDRRQLSDLLKTATSTGYRLQIMADGQAGHQIGNIVTGLQNEVTGKMVDVTVHPYMPQGVCPILTHRLPFPNSEVDSCWTYVNVQDYMGVQWPVTQFTYDFSSYWFGTFLCYAPAWQGAVYGVQQG